EDRAESAQPQRPSVAMSEPKEHADSAPKPSIAMSEPKDTKSQASTSGETQRPVGEEPAEAERKSERRPSEDDTTEIPIGRHHKPPKNDDEGWHAPGWNNQEASRNPYAKQPETGQAEDNKDSQPSEDKYDEKLAAFSASNTAKGTKQSTKHSTQTLCVIACSLPTGFPTARAMKQQFVNCSLPLAKTLTFRVL